MSSTLRFTIVAATSLMIMGSLWGCTQESKKKVAKVRPAVAQTSIADQAKRAAPGGYTIEGDVVFVNNHTCAVSGSPLADKDLTKFQSRVAYDGPVEEFKGKTLVFNQCCNMCIKSFPDMWAKDRDTIMLAHGLLPRN